MRAELVPQACKLIESHGFKVGSSHCAVEARPPVQWNKGRASIYILRTAFGFDWSERIRIIYAGDDVTDEDAMQASLTSWFSVIVSFCMSCTHLVIWSLGFCAEMKRNKTYFPFLCVKEDSREESYLEC